MKTQDRSLFVVVCGWMPCTYICVLTCYHLKLDLISVTSCGFVIIPYWGVLEFLAISYCSCWWCLVTTGWWHILLTLFDGSGNCWLPSYGYVLLLLEVSNHRVLFLPYWHSIHNLYNSPATVIAVWCIICVALFYKCSHQCNTVIHCICNCLNKIKLVT